jgi:hypothetical protein
VVTPRGTQALEISGDSMWDPQSIDAALSFMGTHDMDALVFHDSDMLNKITFPTAFFQPFSSWGAAPPRRGENVIYNCRAYVKRISELCARSGFEFLLELKEIGFPDEVLELHPELLNGGVVCPSNPFWGEFIKTRYDEVCRDFPELNGFIVSVGSPEGRASLTSRRCRCDRCTELSDVAWHRWIVSSIHEAVSPYGKRLVIREFSYTPRDQRAVIEALSTLPVEIEFCIKPYARDYYLPWPDNGALSELTDRPRWLEYDVHGQYFGWGLIPCPVTEDQVRRFTVARDHGVEHAVFRTDWERINSLWAMDSFSRVNLVTAARLQRDPQLPQLAVLADALTDCEVVDRSVPPTEVLELARALDACYQVVLKSLYVGGYVYNVSSMIPNGVRHGWWHMAEQNDLAAWDPSAAGRLDVKDPEVVATLLAEKDAALSGVDEVVQGLRAWRESGSLRLPDPAQLGDVISWTRSYLQAFALSAKVVILSVAAQQRGSLTTGEAGVLESDLDQLERLSRALASAAERSSHRHQADLLLNVTHLRRILSDAQVELSALKAGVPS